MTATPDTTGMNSNWYRMDDAAKALGVSRRTVQRRVAGGHLRSRTQPDGTSWVEVPLQSDRHADAVVGMEAVSRNSLLTDRLMESHHSAIEVYQQRVADLQAEVQTRGRWLRWAGGVAAASLVAATGFGILSSVLASKQGATAGHLQATTSQLDQARGQIEAQNAALVDLKADLAVSQRAVTAVTTEAEMSRAMSQRLRDELSQLEQERACLAEELDAAADRSDMLYLMTGAAD